MSTRLERLSAYLSDAARRPFVWGTFDCCILIADWVSQERGVDALGELRGAYDSEEGAAALVDAAGGMVAMLDEITGCLGMERTDAPQTGDIGVVVSRDVMAAAIRAGPRWSALTARGIAGWRAPAIAAWRV